MYELNIGLIIGLGFLGIFALIWYILYLSIKKHSAHPIMCIQAKNLNSGYHIIGACLLSVIIYGIYINQQILPLLYVGIFIPYIIGYYLLIYKDIFKIKNITSEKKEK